MDLARQKLNYISSVGTDYCDNVQIFEYIQGNPFKKFGINWPINYSLAIDNSFHTSFKFKNLELNK